MSLLNKRSFPFLERGRWYHAFIESDGSAYKVSAVDKEIESVDISSNYMKLPENFVIVDCKEAIHSVSGGSAANVSWLTRIYADGRQGIVLPAKDNFDYMDVYIFGYFA